MCSSPKMPKQNTEPPTILLTKAETGADPAATGSNKRRSDVRLDLNNGTRAYQGLMIPNG